jgi:alpha-amylase/alpha-mannosidase (GH57 family)
MAVRIAVHAHFYQPPRENPRTGTIDEQPDAAPFHDWNERVYAESYRPNAFATIGTEHGEETVNNFERLSFNVGPTLMAWLETEHPDTYARVIEGDRTSRAALGHGNAMAQAFHHSILPLATTRDIRTEVRWGLADFRYRFGHEAEGMWLPETAVSAAVLAILIEEGVRFTILAPHQAGEWREPDGRWVDVADQPIDISVPYLFEHPDGSGRSITLFFYDGDLAQEIAFSGLGASATRFVEAFLSRQVSDDGLVTVATDGETYGHHQKFTELGLAYALFVESEHRDVIVTNPATYLDAHPATRRVRLPAGPGTSWSCAHGVERWRSDCGCSTYGPEGWDQSWRGPLRAGLEVIRWAAEQTFETLASPILVDPWGARDRYVDVVLGATRSEDFLERETAGLADQAALERARALLDLQKVTLSMFTSCGWFFYDVSRIETVQILRYAGEALEIMSRLGLPLPHDAYRPLLDAAHSNDPEEGTAATILEGLLAG